MKQENMILISNRQLTSDVHELILKGSLADATIEPGQFVNLLVPRADLILRRPISIASVDPQNHQLTLVIRAMGAGTAALCAVKPGDTIDVLGPLGHGFPLSFLKPGSTALVIGGGIGIPPLLELVKRLSFQQVKVTLVLGFQTQDAVFYLDSLKPYATLYIATDDGSLETQGTVETVIQTQLKGQSFDAVYACGPKGLNRMVIRRYASHPHAYVSLEERMACGIGACAACVCQKADDPYSNLKVCDDGPVFSTKEVIV